MSLVDVVCVGQKWKILFQNGLCNKSLVNLLCLSADLADNGAFLSLLYVFIYYFYFIYYVFVLCILHFLLSVKPLLDTDSELVFSSVLRWFSDQRQNKLSNHFWPTELNQNQTRIKARIKHSSQCTTGRVLHYFWKKKELRIRKTTCFFLSPQKLGNSASFHRPKERNRKPIQFICCFLFVLMSLVNSGSGSRELSFITD